MPTLAPSRLVSNRVSPARLPRLCVALQAATPAELLARAEHAALNGHLIELRLDALKNPSAFLSPLREFLRSWPELTVIATCRKKTYGGAFTGALDAEWKILREAAAAGCAMVDLELQSAERLPGAALTELRRHTSLIVSYHDFETTPALEPLIERMQAIPADFYKIVPTATSWHHNLDLLRFLESHKEHPLIAFCMGETGVASRILCLRSGSVFTYARPGSEAGTAPGQLTIEELRNLYRIDGLNRATQIYGVLGESLTHSLSPLMHNAAFRRLGLNALYLPLPSRRPAEVLDFADEIPLRGFSVTIPHKSAILDRLERLDPLARAVGAVNTVVRSQGKFYGYNTDVAGIADPLAQVVALRGAKILVLGAGGAARAAVFGLSARGAHVYLHNRTAARAEALARAAKLPRDRVLTRARLKKMDFQALVQATPVGQYPNVKKSPLAADELHAGVVFDLVYNPLETELIRMARAAGARVIPGIEMFVHQGVRQFELWTGKPAPADDMRREVLAALTAAAVQA